MNTIKTGDQFLHVFAEALRTGRWHQMEHPVLIRFVNKETGKKDCPLTIVTEFITGKPCQACFLMPELQATGVDEWLIVRIAYAIDKCDIGSPYGRRLRRNLEKICRAAGNLTE